MSNSSCWNERYRGAPAIIEPSKLLVKFSGLFPAHGRALDIACGGGRNSVYLAGRGLCVLGIDRSWEALQQGRELARRQGRNVAWVQGDLEAVTLPIDAFDVITCFYYRHPTLYPSLRAALRSGGLLFFETFTRDQLNFSSGPRNPAHLLEPRELLQAFGDWDVLFYRETWVERGMAVLVARKPKLRV